MCMVFKGSLVGCKSVEVVWLFTFPHGLRLRGQFSTSLFSFLNPIIITYKQVKLFSQTPFLLSISSYVCYTYLVRYDSGSGLVI